PCPRQEVVPVRLACGGSDATTEGRPERAAPDAAHDQPTADTARLHVLSGLLGSFDPRLHGHRVQFDLDEAVVVVLDVVVQGAAPEAGVHGAGFHLEIGRAHV